MRYPITASDARQRHAELLQEAECGRLARRVQAHNAVAAGRPARMLTPFRRRTASARPDCS